PSGCTACDSPQDLGERGAVYSSRGTMRICRRGKAEGRSMKSLVEQTVPVVIEPEDLEAIGSPVGEYEEAAAARIGAELLLHGEREPIEGAAHVDGLGADEDADASRDHALASSASTKRTRAAGSKSCGTRSRRPRSSSISRRPTGGGGGVAT